MDKTSFFDKLHSMSAREFPTEWMAEAWDDEEIRSDLTYGLSHMVSKVGELAHSAAYLDLLARALSHKQLIQLYMDIRDNSYRHEEEWREEFERTFPEVADLLPAPFVFVKIDVFLNGGELPVAWARQVWEVERAREFIATVLATDLKQGGDFWHRPDWMEHLNLCLTREQIVRLYTDLRDRSGKPEPEWRHVFEKAFPDCVKSLPKPLD